MVEKTFAELTGDERITYGNRLICEFVKRKNPWWFKKDRCKSYQSGYFYSRMYSRNWATLMKVWEKILSLSNGAYGEIRKNCIILDYDTLHPYYDYHKVIGNHDKSPEKLKEKSMIMATWACCVYFIEWYNKHKNEQIQN